MRHADILIIGSGIAGLSLALKASALGQVTVVTKKASADSATNLAQGGIAAVLSREDSTDLHIQDTLRSGAGLCHEDIVRLVVESGGERVRELVRLGVQFQHKYNSPEMDLGLEGGHSARRVAHAMDLTGREIERALLAQAQQDPNITLLENHLAVDLIMAERGRPAGGQDRCLGAYVLERESGQVQTWQATATVLTTGGGGKVYLYSTNPDIATGDGVAMAYRAGALVANLEFVQFHPTCFFHRTRKNFLISEAVRGEGGVLVNAKGERFMQHYDSRGDLATRDAVARAIDAEMKASGAECVFLDISHLPADRLRTRFPTIYATCLQCGVDMARDPIPVVPAAHYMCGGVLVDSWGRSSVDNLFALGETACTGLHGANRLASNSLLEAVVFADQAASWLQLHWDELRQRRAPAVSPWASDHARGIEEKVLVSHNWDQIRRLMWNYVGIVRRRQRLELVTKRLVPVLEEIRAHFHDYTLSPDLVELRNIAVLARLIVACASSRLESRGLHYMADYPQPSERFQRDTICARFHEGAALPPWARVLPAGRDQVRALVLE